MARQLDRNGLEILSPEECVALLATVPIGRVVLSSRGVPVAFPVTFTLDGQDIVYRTAVGRKLSAAEVGSVAAFEADHYDPADRTGWSVLVIGTMHEVTDPEEVARLTQLPLQPWVPHAPDHFIRIRPVHISGRRIPTGTGP